MAAPRLPSVCSRCGARVRSGRLFAAIFLLALAPFGSTLRAEEPFDARVQRAKRVEASADGKAYMRALWTQIGAYSSVAMRECFRQGTQPDTPAFVLIANVLPDRRFSQVDLQPRTPMAICYVEHLADAPFPAPPEIFGDVGIPIVIEMTIRP